MRFQSIFQASVACAALSAQGVFAPLSAVAESVEALDFVDFPAPKIKFQSDLDPERIRVLGLSSRVENPQDFILSLRAADNILDFNAFELTSEQHQLFLLIKSLRETPRGRDLIDQAKAADVWFCIDEGFNDGQAYYATGMSKMIGFVMEVKRSSNDQIPCRVSHNTLLANAYHELEHFLQYDVREKAHDNFPAGTRSFDIALWRLCEEAQADMQSHYCMEQYALISGAADDSDRRFVTEEDYLLFFVNDIATKSTQHAELYRFFDSDLEGQSIPFEQFVEAFGTMPDRDGNFLSGVTSHSLLIDTLIRANPEYWKHWRGLHGEKLVELIPAPVFDALTP